MRMELRERALDKLFKRRDRIDIPDYQRTEVWKTEKKQMLMDTILRGWHLPKLYFRRLDEDSFECVDGQQRLLTVWEFYDNKLPLSEETQNEFGGPYYINLEFSVSDKVDDFLLQIEEIEDATEAEIQELFQRLQLGDPLNPAEKLNAIGGQIRDFLKELTLHSFFKKKVAVKDTRYAYLDMLSKVAFIEIYGIQSQVRFKQLKNMYEENKSFKSGTAAAQNIKRAINYLDRAFSKKSLALRNRSSIISVCHLASEVVKRKCDRGTATSFGQFIEKFIAELRSEVEKGSNASNKDLLAYQSAIMYGSTGGESIRTRLDVLSRGLALHDSRFAPILGKTPKKSQEELVGYLSSEVSELIFQCNSVYSRKHGHDLFKITNETQRALRLIARPVKNVDEYGTLVDSLYKLIYEGSGSGKRITDSKAQIIKDINLLRTDLRHDIHHGKEKKIRSKAKKIGEVLRRYTGKPSVQLLTKEEFYVTQLKILMEVKNELKKLTESLA